MSDTSENKANLESFANRILQEHTSPDEMLALRTATLIITADIIEPDGTSDRQMVVTREHGNDFERLGVMGHVQERIYDNLNTWE